MWPTCESGEVAGEKKRSGGGGRRRTELKYIEKESTRQVTFSKRKGGLFRKAGHLSMMSADVEVAVLVMSTKGKPYSFGSPSVDSVVDRYLNGGVGSPEKDMWWWEVAVEGMAEEELRKYREFLENLKVMVRERMRVMTIT